MTHYLVSSAAALITLITAGSGVVGDDVIELNAGTYTASAAGAVSGANVAGKGVFRVTVTGTSGHNIIIQPYQGAIVRINGGFEAAGFITIQGLEIAPTPTTRVFADKASVDFPIGIYNNAGGLNVFDCYIHDCQEGIALFKTDAASTDTITISGNVITNCGYYTADLDRWRDYGIYTNNHPGGTIAITKNYFGPCGGPWGVDMYSTTDRKVQDYQVTNNTFFDAGIDCAIGTDSLVDDNLIHENEIYIIDAGYGQNDRQILFYLGDYANTEDITFTDNYYVGKGINQMALMYPRQLTMTGNTVIKLAGPGTAYFISHYLNTHAPLANTVNTNTYINLGTKEFVDILDPDVYLTFAEWKAQEGFDAASTYSTTTLPSANRIVSNVIRGRYFVTVYNWTMAATVNITVSNAGSYKISNPLNMAESIIRQSVNGEITVPMTGWTCAPMSGDYTGHAENVITSPWPAFGAFIIDPLALSSDIVFDYAHSNKYELWLCDPTGVRTALLDRASGFACSRVTNAVGAAMVELPPLYDDMLGEDFLLEIWRRPLNGSFRLFNVYRCRKWRYEDTDSGNELTYVWGYDGNLFLDDRIVANDAESAQALMTDEFDDMLKAIFTDQLGADAGAGRDMRAVGGGLTVAADLTAAPSGTMGFSWQNVLKTFQKIADASRQAGTKLYFDMVPSFTSAGLVTWEFKTFTGQRGIDQTWDSACPVFFGRDWGNLQSGWWENDASEEVTYEYGRGQGTKGDRFTGDAYDTARMGASIWNRREDYANASSGGGGESNASTLAYAQSQLIKGRPKISAGGVLLDTSQARYGIDFDFGSLVTIDIRKRQFEAEIVGVSFSMDGGGNESADFQFEVME